MDASPGDAHAHVHSYDSAALAPLALVAGVLAAISLAYAVLHPLTHPVLHGFVMGGVAALTAVVCGCLALTAKAGKVPPRYSHLALAAVALLCTVDSVTDVWIYDDVRATTN